MYKRRAVVIVLALTLCGCKVIAVPAPFVSPTSLVDVGGYVASPGAVEVPADGLKLWSAVIRAGGVIREPSSTVPASRLAVALHRSNRKYFFALALVEGQAAGQIQLMSGDVVRVISLDELTLSNPGEGGTISEQSSRNMSLLQFEGSFSAVMGAGQHAEGHVADLALAPAGQATPARAADNDSLGLCEADIDYPSLQGVPAAVNDAFGNPAAVSVVVRAGALHPAEVETYVVPTSRFGTLLGRNAFDPQVLSQLYVQDGDLAAFANLEQLPIVSSSIAAPYIKAAMDQQAAFLARNGVETSKDVYCPDVPIIGPCCKVFAQMHRKLHTVVLEPYSYQPATLPMVPAVPGYPLSIDGVTAVP